MRTIRRTAGREHYHLEISAIISMAGCLENNGALMRRAESLLTHMSRKYVGRVYVHAASLYLSFYHSFPLVYIYTHMIHLICSESLAAAALRVAIHTSERDTELRPRRIIKLYARASSNVMRHYHLRTNDLSRASEHERYSRVRIACVSRNAISARSLRVLFGNFYPGKVAKLFRTILPFKPII